MNIGHQPELSIWSGWMVDPEKKLLLVLEKDREIDDVRNLLLRVGLTEFAGYLAGGMTAWNNAALPVQRLEQISVHVLKRQTGELQVVDVRKDDEWEEGHVPDATHAFVPQLAQRLDEFDSQRPTVTYCATDYRANLAASLLQQRGLNNVRSVPGSWSAWTNAGLPVAGSQR